MTFLYRNERGEVTWAYPVTVAQTPHRLTFGSGEQVNAAWAIDAIATPFVQGQLRDELLSVIIETQCTNSGHALHIELDSALNYRVLETDAEPLVFVPLVDIERLEDPSIIDAFWNNSVFFWSEEHARQYHKQMKDLKGLYLTLPQAIEMTPLTQGALFDFKRRSLEDLKAWGMDNRISKNIWTSSSLDSNWIFVRKQGRGMRGI
jgi:hypothetical protein